VSWPAWSLWCSDSYAGRGKQRADHEEPYRLTSLGGWTATHTGSGGTTRSIHGDEEGVP
jgi:hypothetical protein